MSNKEIKQKKSIARIFYEVELEKEGLPVDDDSFDESLEKFFHGRAKKTEAAKNTDLSSQLNQPPAFPLWMYWG